MVSRVGLHRNQWHQYAWGNSPWHSGVTTVLKVQDSIQGPDRLINWNVDTALDALIEGLSREDAKARTNAARDRGTAVHLGIEAMIRGIDYTPTPDTFPYWYGWGKFLLNEQIEPMATEQMTINLTAGFGGTIDLIAKHKGKVVQIDVKTGDPKPEHALQLAGYAAGEWLGAPDDPKKYAMPKFEAHYVLSLKPDPPYYELIPLTVGPEETEHFLWLVETRKRLKAWDKKEAA